MKGYLTAVSRRRIVCIGCNSPFESYFMPLGELPSNRHMKTVKFQTTWGPVTLKLNSNGKVIALVLPLLSKDPRKPFSASDLQALEALTGRHSPVETPDGTPFQQAVWNELKKIPRGQTRTYGEIAATMGHPKAARAVGSACGANPLPLLIPCHRAVAAKGLGGFSCGLPWKKLLLEIEACEPKKNAALPRFGKAAGLLSN
jgi:O-6-methylguanine DNA methyltransferase